MAPDSTIESLAGRLRAVPTPNARALLQKKGVERVVIMGLQPIVSVTGPIAGPARTVRYLPAREDLPRAPKGSPNRWQVDNIGVGEVIVCDAMGCMDGAVMGDMMAARAAHRGAAGLIADGVVRDVDGLAPLGLPTYARGTHPDPWMGRLIPWEVDTEIQCGGVLVRPGDWILADATAIVVIPADLADYVAEQDEADRAEEMFCQALIAAGFALDDAYPLPERMRPHLERYRRDGAIPSAADLKD